MCYCNPIFLVKVILVCFTEAVIGMEKEVCVVHEDVGEMEVCVVVRRPELDCPIIFPFDMIFYTTPGTAREYNPFINYPQCVLNVHNPLFQC